MVQIDYQNVEDYLYFLTSKYAPLHFEPLCTICESEQRVQDSSIKRLLTFALAYFENNLEMDAPLTTAANELLMACYENERNNLKEAKQV